MAKPECMITAMTEDQNAQRQAAGNVRMAILRRGGSWLPVDPNRRPDSDDNLNQAVAALPESLHRNRPAGAEVILADLNTFLGLPYNDRNDQDGHYYPPRPAH